jgi:hypothetical protein
MAQRVKIIEDIPKEDLEAMITVHKNDGAQVGYKEQPNGKFRLEAVFGDSTPVQPDTVRSLVSGDALKPG